MKFLFVCKGNVSRSQMAEVIFNKLAKGKHTAKSAGTRVVREGVNREGERLADKDGAEDVITVMKESGLDVSNKTRNQVTPEMLSEADRAIVMAQPETIPEYLAKSDKVTYWEVPDPAGGTLEFTREVRDKIRALVTRLVDTLEQPKS